MKTTSKVASWAGAVLAGGGMLFAGMTVLPADAAAPSTYTVKGVDTSHFNHDGGQSIDWKKVRSAGQSFMYAKATEGADWTDEWFQRDLQGAKQAGLLHGAYHLWGFTPGAAQAQNFVRTVRAAGYTGKGAGELPPMLDLELRSGGSCPRNFSTAQVGAFLNVIDKEMGVKPIIYAAKPFVDRCMNADGSLFARHVLWQPRYQSGSTEPTDLPRAGAHWKIWQYSEHGKVPGINSDKVDLNVFRGTLAELQQLAHQTGTTLTPPTAPSVPAAPVLKRQSRGTDVVTAQELLIAHGARIEADGVFGPATSAAVRSFQTAKRLTADGIIGPRTWGALLVTVKEGSRGEAVSALQHQLIAHGARIEADGVFGPATSAAVRSFQTAKRLTADGIAGPRTWAALLADRGTTVPPTQPANGRLTNRQALAQLAAAGIKHPVGRTSLEGVRARTIQGVIALKKASGCTITVTGGTESGHSAGPLSHAKGYKLDLRTRDEGTCVTKWIKNTQHKGKSRGNDPRWYGNLAGASLEYVYETPKGGGVHWDITFN
ncbi:peptidoglycan-binding protein [Streptomyces spiralis]|uniref:peptidoglycan-binding protein n=1 Tax=Streptomyces spiralis TaxID=66376 RepID=UPI0036CBBA2D